MANKVFYMQAYTSAGERGLNIDELLDGEGFEVLDTPTGFSPMFGEPAVRVIKVTVEFADEEPSAVA